MIEKTLLILTIITLTSSCSNNKEPDNTSMQSQKTQPSTENKDALTEAIPISEEDQLRMEGIPKVPQELSNEMAPWLDTPPNTFAGFTQKGEILALTRISGLRQAVSISAPFAPGKPITQWPEPVRDIEEHPSEHGVFIFSSDVGGNERFTIHRMETGGNPSLLSHSNQRTTARVWNRKGTGFAFNSNARNGEHFDIWFSDGISESSKRLITASESYWIPLDWSSDDTKLLVQDYRSSTESNLLIVDFMKGTSTAFDGTETGFSYAPALWGENDETIYLVSDRDGAFRRLWRVNQSTKQWSCETCTINQDVERIAISHNRKTLAWTSNDSGISRLYLRDLLSGNTKQVTGLPSGVISTMMFDQQDKKIGLTVSSGVSSGDVWICNIETNICENWTRQTIQGIDPKTLREAELIELTAPDGVKISGFLYRPTGIGPHPVLISLHGGPESQARPDFDVLVQFLVTQRQIAVLEPNVRGSSGYGREFLKLDDGVRRVNAIADIEVFLDWIATDPGLDNKRVMVRGGSYGGYLTLMSLTKYPSRFIAGISSVGIANLVSFLEKTEAYRRDVRRREYGDEREPTMRENLIDLSPVTHANKILAPLLIVHGANDPRVPLFEAEQIIKIVRNQGTDVWTLIANNEGHGFKKRKNLDRYLLAQVQFIQHVLSLHSKSP